MSRKPPSSEFDSRAHDRRCTVDRVVEPRRVAVLGPIPGRAVAGAVVIRDHRCDTRSMKLYHVTSRVLAERIKADGFHGHETFYGQHPATGGNWLKNDSETESTLGLVLLSIEVPDDEVADQPTPDPRVLESDRTDDYFVDAEILNRHLDSVQIES